MSREIKFRAWDGDKMVHDGDSWTPKKYRHKNLRELAVQITNKGIYWIKSRIDDLGYVRVTSDDGKTTDFYSNWDDSRLDTENIWLMQFTGLHDKNGVEIYEGDIVEGKDDDGDILKHSVKYRFGGFEPFVGPYCIESLNCVVLGNIYEHSHLLETGNDRT